MLTVGKRHIILAIHNALWALLVGAQNDMIAKLNTRDPSFNWLFPGPIEEGLKCDHARKEFGELQSRMPTHYFAF